MLLKKGHEYNESVLSLVRPQCSKITILETDRSAALDPLSIHWTGDYLISYLCQRIIPGPLLSRASKAAINFHPGPPEYPGIGCTNFAIYHERKSFGVTCHLMHDAVDCGPIIAVRRFDIDDSDTVFSLTQKCYSHLISLLETIIAKIACDSTLQQSNERWARPAYRRSELDELCRITIDMSNQEIKRRVRATTFPNRPGAFLEIGGYRFEYKAEE